MAVQLLRRSFTVEEYHRMAQAGILGEDDRVELIDGEILKTAPIGSRHAACVDRLTQILADQVRGRSIVRVQNPVRLGHHSEPQPDLALLKARHDFYAQGHPGPEDTLLLVEVVETSAEVDRAVKVPLYARSGISEVWLVDLIEDRIEVYRQPTPQGYQQVQQLCRGERLAPLSFPDLVLVAESILG